MKNIISTVAVLLTFQSIVLIVLEFQNLITQTLELNSRSYSLSSLVSSIDVLPPTPAGLWSTEAFSTFQNSLDGAAYGYWENIDDSSEMRNIAARSLGISSVRAKNFVHAEIIRSLASDTDNSSWFLTADNPSSDQSYQTYVNALQNFYQEDLNNRGINVLEENTYNESFQTAISSAQQNLLEADRPRPFVNSDSYLTAGIAEQTQTVQPAASNSNEGSSFWVKVGFSFLFGISALWVVLRGTYPEKTETWAFGMLTLISGVWIGTYTT